MAAKQAEVGTNGADPVVITDVELDKALIAARVLEYAKTKYYGRDKAATYLNAGGIKVNPEEGGTEPQTWTVDMAYVMATAGLGEKIQVNVSTYRGQPDMTGTVEKLAEKFYYAIRGKTFDVTPDPVPEPAYTYATLLAQYGQTGPFPAGSEEVEASRKEIVEKILARAENHGACPEVEVAFVRAGLGRYLAPGKGDVTVSLPGGVEIVLPGVELNRRTGKPQNLQSALAQWLKDSEGRRS